jgi:hypothetical protein
MRHRLGLHTFFQNVEAKDHFAMNLDTFESFFFALAVRIRVKKCAEVLSLAIGKTFFTGKLNFLGLGKFSKNSFFGEKIFGNFLTQEFYTFLKSAQNSVSFDTL